MSRDHQGYEYRGERRYVDGVPFGSWLEPGDHYISPDGHKIHVDDMELVPRDKCHAIAIQVARRFRKRIKDARHDRA